MRDAKPEHWAERVRRELGATSPRDRLKADWNRCAEAAQNLEAHAPVEYGPMPSMLVARSAKEICDGSVELRKAWASWRKHVTEIETRNAKRLEVLADMIRKLSDLYGKTTDKERVQNVLATLGNFAAQVWNVTVPLGEEVPNGKVNLREWSLRATRRADLLPDEWRTLRC